MKKGFFQIRGRNYLCFILREYIGAADVQIIESGLCFRVSGLPIKEEHTA